MIDKSATGVSFSLRFFSSSRVIMFFSAVAPQSSSRATVAAALFGTSLTLSGCAGISETIAPAFANPAQYELYNCTQIDAERKDLA